MINKIQPKFSYYKLPIEKKNLNPIEKKAYNSMVNLIGNNTPKFTVPKDALRLLREKDGIKLLLKIDRSKIDVLNEIALNGLKELKKKYNIDLYGKFVIDVATEKEVIASIKISN